MSNRARFWWFIFLCAAVVAFLTAFYLRIVVPHQQDCLSHCGGPHYIKTSAR